MRIWGGPRKQASQPLIIESKNGFCFAFFGGRKGAEKIVRETFRVKEMS